MVTPRMLVVPLMDCVSVDAHVLPSQAVLTERGCCQTACTSRGPQGFEPSLPTVKQYFSSKLFLIVLSVTNLLHVIPVTQKPFCMISYDCAFIPLYICKFLFILCFITLLSFFLGLNVITSLYHNIISYNVFCFSISFFCVFFCAYILLYHTKPLLNHCYSNISIKLKVPSSYPSDCTPSHHPLHPVRRAICPI